MNTSALPDVPVATLVHGRKLNKAKHGAGAYLLSFIKHGKRDFG